MAANVIGQGVTADGQQFAEIQSADGRRAKVYGPQAQQAIQQATAPPTPAPAPAPAPARAHEPVPTSMHAPPAELVGTPDSGSGDLSFLGFEAPGQEPAERSASAEPQLPGYAIQRTPGSYRKARWTPGTETTTRQDIAPEYVEAVQRADLNKARAEAAVGAAEAAVAPEVNAAQAAAADAAQIYHETQVAEAQQAREADIDRRIAEVEDMTDQFAQKPPPSEKEFWKGLGPSAAMGLIIGQSLSTYGRLMLGQGPSDAVDKAIGQSIQQQRMALAKERDSVNDAKGLVAEYRRQDMDQRQAEAAAELTYRKNLDRQLQVRMGQIRQPVMRQKLEAMAADNRQKLAEKWLGLQKDTAAKVVSNRKFEPGRYVGGGEKLLVNHEGRMLPIQMAKKLGWKPGQGDQQPIPRTVEAAVEAARRGDITAKEAQGYIDMYRKATPDLASRSAEKEAKALQNVATELLGKYSAGDTAGISGSEMARARVVPGYSGMQWGEKVGADIREAAGYDRGRQGEKEINRSMVNRLAQFVGKEQSGAAMSDSEIKRVYGSMGLVMNEDNTVVLGVNEPILKKNLEVIKKSGAEGLQALVGKYQREVQAARDIDKAVAEKGKKGK